MKKHILSNYLRHIVVKESTSMFDSTFTKSIETTDPDEFRVLESTDETRAIETSDADEFHDNTTTTFVIETSDSDEFSLSFEV